MGTSITGATGDSRNTAEYKYKYKAALDLAPAVMSGP